MQFGYADIASGLQIAGLAGVQNNKIAEGLVVARG